MKKIYLLSLILFLTIFSNSIQSAPIYIDGKYQGKSTIAGELTIKCGWQWWKTCATIDHGVLTLDNGDVYPLCRAVNDSTVVNKGEYSTEQTSQMTNINEVRPMYKTYSDDPEDAGCQYYFTYVYVFAIN